MAAQVAYGSEHTHDLLASIERERRKATAMIANARYEIKAAREVLADFAAAPEWGQDSGRRSAELARRA